MQKAQLARTERRPALARAEIVDKATRGRFEMELEAAVKRRPSNEAKLAGALRAIAPLSHGLRGVMAETVGVMLKRGSLARELYAGSMRALGELEDKSAAPLLRSALAGDEAGGTAALSAACFSRDAAIAGLLGKLAASRQSHLAFGAELARVARGESNGAHLAALAPMIKESHRISMCLELFMPLVRGRPQALVGSRVGPALAVLRSAERHLGRWLVLAEVAVRAGDRTPIEEATSRCAAGPVSARAAWSLLLWALDSASGKSTELPETRPTLELIARLSDRPSADRDTTFLFRMAPAPVAKPMLEALAKPRGPDGTLADEQGVRAAMFLASAHGRDELRDVLATTATTAKREELRGVAAAALWDVGDAQRAREIADDLVASRVIGNVAWGTLIRAASRLNGSHGSTPLLEETQYRWIQCGWLE